MEVSGSLEMYKDLDYKQLSDLSRQYGITLWSLHLPFSPFEQIDISRPELSGQTVAYYEALIQKASAIGIRHFIVHPSGEPIQEADRPARLACAKESLRRLGDIATQYGAVIAVENLPRTCLGNRAEELKRIISVNDKLRVCFDFNHSLGEDNSAYIKLLGDKIITTHVSDYDLIDERHWLPGEGKVDWVEMITLMEQADYQGVWMYELGFKAPASIDRRELTWQDFGDNARTIFAKKQPEAIGTSLL